jgi:hypothetical protein
MPATESVPSSEMPADHGRSLQPAQVPALITPGQLTARRRAHRRGSRQGFREFSYRLDHTGIALINRTQPWIASQIHSKKQRDHA